MNVLEAIKTRRSIRKFTGEVIDDKKIDVLLRAGFQAPSSSNFEPTNFVVVKDKEKLEEVGKNNEYARMVPKAGCAIIVCGDNTVEPEEGYLIADCSAALQNILLAAHGMGLGAVWCGLHPDEDLHNPIKATFNLPNSMIAVGIIAVGYLAEEKRELDRYRENRVQYDGWKD